MPVLGLVVQHLRLSSTNSYGKYIITVLTIVPEFNQQKKYNSASLNLGSSSTSCDRKEQCYFNSCAKVRRIVAGNNSTSTSVTTEPQLNKNFGNYREKNLSVCALIQSISFYLIQWPFDSILYHHVLQLHRPFQCIIFPCTTRPGK